ncbi:MAG: CDP-archaeol synthase [Planctomycetes bacterium]|nr:CDP-archaeol synthase [Planctomycetota bacterium]
MNVEPTFANVMYTVLPVTLANVFHMFAVKSNWLKAMAIPIDQSKCWRGERIFGDHKTWRGLCIIVLMTILLCLGQFIAENFIQKLRVHNLINYLNIPWWQVGTSWGLGYALAEFPNSFFKRRFGVAAGKGRSGFFGAVLAFIDQADSAVGVALASMWCLGLSAGSSLWIAIYCTALHLVINFILGMSKIRKRAL